MITTNKLQFKYHKILSIFILILTYNLTFSQTAKQLEHQKVYYTNDLGKLFAPCSLPVFLNISSQPNGQGITTEAKPSTGDEMYFSEGKNTICNNVALKTKNGTKKIKQCYDIYGDATAPASEIFLKNAQKYKTKKATFYGKDLKIKINATDKLSGWNSAFISKNNSTFENIQNFNQSFENGEHTINYYSIDNVGNIETPKAIKFYVDLTSPKTEREISGIYDENILSKEAKIVLTSADELSGVKTIFYKINDKKEEKYIKPIELTKLKAGSYSLTYYSVDNVGNIEEINKWEFIYDIELPKAELIVSGNIFEKENTSFVASQPQISITASDSLSQIERIEYELNTDPNLKYENEFTLDNRSGLHRITYFAFDKVENRSQKYRKSIYLDISPPKTYYKTTKSCFWNKDTLIISGNTGIVLKSTDMEAGVKQTFLSINNETEQIYTDTLFFETGQIYNFSFYSTDNVNNREEPQNVFIRVEEKTRKIITQTEQHPKNWIMGNEQLIGSTNLPFYIKISASPDEDAKSYLVLTEDNKPLMFNKHGINELKIKNSFTNQRFKIPIDGISPKTKAVYSGAKKYTVGKTIYYGNNLNLKLSSEDNKKTSSGLDAILYSVNGSEFGKYKSDLKIFSREQKYTISYYAIDSVKNQEKNHVDSFIIDITPPLTVAEFGANNFGNILSNKSKISLTATDNLSGVANIYYYFDKEEKARIYRSKISSTDFAKLSEGTHTLYYYATDNVENKERIQFLPIIIDQNPPEIELLAHGSQHTKGSTLYLSKYGTISLSAEEKTTEVKNIKYNISGGKTQEYVNQNISFPQKNGLYYFNYFAEDKVANIKKETQKIYIDTEPPNSSISFVGETFKPADKIIVSSKTKLKISSGDNASGINKIYYNTGAGNRQYDKPFSVKGNGNKKISYYAIDNVSNRETKKSIEVVADNTAPEIKIVLTPSGIEESENIFSVTPYSLLHISATDATAGIKGIFYTINDGEKLVYRKPISGFIKGQALRIKIIAYDRVGNSNERTIFLKIK